LALTIRESLLMTASLSAVHLLGVTLVGGGALVSGLRFGGVLLADRPVYEVARPAARAILIGLSICAATGLLLFAPRASAAAGNTFFRWKMLLLLSASASQLLLYGRVTKARGGTRLTRSIAFLASALWFGVVATGCAYILLE
jgi:Family of unknown function (DUF6644)